MATKKITESEQVEAITEDTIAEEPKPVAKKPRARKAENAPKEEEGFGAEEVPMAENEGVPLMESDLSEEEIASEVAEDLKAEQENGFALTGREISRAGYVNDLTGTTMDETFARIMSLKRRGVICSSKVAAVRKKGGPIPFDAVVLDYRGIPVSNGLKTIWIAKSVSLKGCVGQGNTSREAIRELEENERVWLSVAKEERIPIP